jgi:hypothetical protein
MKMKEEDKKRDNLERAKTIMGKIDPALLSAALSEMMVEADEAEEADVAKVKEAIKGIYDKIPEGKDKKSIISKAFTELDSDIVEKEVRAIKENLASIDRETIMEAAKDYFDVKETIQLPWCKIYSIKPECKYIIRPCDYFVCGICLSRICSVVLCGYCISSGGIACPRCISYGIPGKPDWVEYPLIKEQLKEEIIQELLQRPELSRAMKKMLNKIQDEK